MAENFWAHSIARPLGISGQLSYRGELHVFDGAAYSGQPIDYSKRILPLHARGILPSIRCSSLLLAAGGTL